MDLAQRLRRHPDAVYKIVDGEALIILPGTSSIHVLNEVGARVWQMLDGSMDVEGLGRAISEEFEVGPESAEQDVREFVQALAANSMLAIGEDGGGTDERSG